LKSDSWDGGDNWDACLSLFRFWIVVVYTHAEGNDRVKAVEETYYLFSKERKRNTYTTAMFCERYRNARIEQF